MNDASTKPLILFGTGTLTRLAAHCITQDTRRKIDAMTVESSSMTQDSLDGYPIVPFERLSDHFSPETHEVLVPVGYRSINGFRMMICQRVESMGFKLASYISSRASLWPDTVYGTNVLVYENAIIQSCTSLGDNVIVRAGSNIGHHTKVGSHSFIASGVVTGGDVSIGERCWIGLGATLRDNIKVADRSFIGMGAVVIEDTQSDGVYVGVPAKRVPGKSSMDVTLGDSN